VIFAAKRARQVNAYYSQLGEGLLEYVGRRPWSHAAAVWLPIVTAGTVALGSDWWGAQQFGLFAFIFGGAGAGDSVRMRRAYISEVTERARQAEQTREEEARRRVMDERLRIARELHDVVAHHIAVISVQAAAASHLLDRRPEQVRPALDLIRVAGDDVLKELSSIVGVLRQSDDPVVSTEPTPGLSRLPALLDTIAAAGLKVGFRQDGEQRELPAMADLAAYRIVQEALTNAHKYGTGSAELTLTWNRTGLTVDVVNESGHRVAAGSGYGIVGMRERAAAAGGTLDITETADGRFRVRAVLLTKESS
jgi:signal transduction histidine kinase